MKTIWKYQPEVSIGLPFRLDLPFMAEVISAGLQAGKTTLWAIVSPNQPLPSEARLFVVYGGPYGTGWEINPELRLEHIATYTEKDYYVWHLFEIKNQP